MFSELVRGIGVQGVQVEELYDLDGPYFNGTSDPRKPVYGLVFLFKWRSGEESERFADPGECPDVYFAQQSTWLGPKANRGLTLFFLLLRQLSTTHARHRQSSASSSTGQRSASEKT